MVKATYLSVLRSPGLPTERRDSHSGPVDLPGFCGLSWWEMDGWYDHIKIFWQAKFQDKAKMVGTKYQAPPRCPQFFMLIGSGHLRLLRHKLKRWMRLRSSSWHLWLKRKIVSTLVANRRILRQIESLEYHNATRCSIYEYSEDIEYHVLGSRTLTFSFWGLTYLLQWKIGQSNAQLHDFLADPPCFRYRSVHVVILLNGTTGGLMCWICDIFSRNA